MNQLITPSQFAAETFPLWRDFMEKMQASADKTGKPQRVLIGALAIEAKPR